MSVRSVYAKYKNTFLTVWFPSRKDINSLAVGDQAPDPFGRESEVTRIYSQGKTDREGRAFVLYYVQFGPQSEISMGLVEDSLPRTVDLSAKLTSAEIDNMEENLRREHK